MPDQHDSRRKMVFVVVLGVVALALGTMLLIGLLSGDDTDDTTQQPEEADQTSSLLGGPAAALVRAA